MSVTVKSYAPMQVNLREVRRYAGYIGENEAVDALIKECIREIGGALSYKACYSVFPIKISANAIDLGFTTVVSGDLAKCLSDCEKIIVFASSVGLGADRLIKKYSAVSPAKALVMNALCTERIESLCDAFCDEMREEFSKNGSTLTPRFSPGYGDLSLDLQTDLIRITEAQKHIGITLSENLIMIPTKSVTAIIGIKQHKMA